MNAKIRLFFLTMYSLFVAVISATSQLQAQNTKPDKPPLSFYSLGKDQQIRFFVFTQHPPAQFHLEVSTQPQPQVKIMLDLTSNPASADNEKLWGHPANEWISRPLAAKDVQTLENFLTTFRARGEFAPAASSGHPAMHFELITKRKAKEGFMRSDIDKQEFYNPSEEAMRDFIKNFIGLKVGT